MQMSNIPVATTVLTVPSVTHQSDVGDQLGAALRAAIIAGRMRVGITYSAPALANELDASAAPARQGMLDLVHENLVDVDHDGFRVAAVSDRELDEFVEAGQFLESPL